jgi:nicotinamidase-related amidase
MKTALLLIDMQNDYFEKGKMELTGAEEASLKAKELLNFFREKNLPIIHIQHFATREGSTFFIPNTDGVNIHKNVEPINGEKIIRKAYPNSFRDTGLLDHIVFSGIHRLVICGMMTHMCVDATARAAFDYGFENVVVKDATATKELVFEDKTIPAEQVQAAFLSALNGIYAKVISTDELFKRAKTQTQDEQKQ